MTDTTSRTSRWFASGHSADPDSAAAGRQAAAAALAGDDPKLVFVFASVSHDLPALLAAVAEATGDAPLVGCTTAGEIASSGAADLSVTVAALGGPGFDVVTAAAEGAAADPRAAGDAVASALADQAGEPRASRVMLMFPDGLIPDQDELVRGVYEVVGASVPVVGGFAGDEWRFDGTYQFHNGRIHNGAVVAALLDSDGPIGIGVRHGWRRVGEPLLVTSSSANRVYTLDDEPAIKAYQRLLDVPEEAMTDPQAFGYFAATHPLGISRRSGEEVRVIGEADLEEGWLQSWSPVPQGGMAWLMEGDYESVQRSTAEACEDARRGLGDQPPIGVLAFDCIGRRSVLGDEGLVEEVSTMGNLGAPVAGFYTYGEIARLSGPNGFHNQTLVLLALG